MRINEVYGALDFEWGTETVLARVTKVADWLSNNPSEPYPNQEELAAALEDVICDHAGFEVYSQKRFEFDPKDDSAIDRDIENSDILNSGIRSLNASEMEHLFRDYSATMLIRLRVVDELPVAWRRVLKRRRSEFVSDRATETQPMINWRRRTVVAGSIAAGVLLLATALFLRPEGTRAASLDSAMAQAEQNLNDPERVSIAVNLEFEQKLVRPQEVTLVVFVPDLAIGSPSPITEAPRRVDSNRDFEFSEDIPAFAGQEDSRLFVLGRRCLKTNPQENKELLDRRNWSTEA